VRLLFALALLAAPATAEDFSICDAWAMDREIVGLSEEAITSISETLRGHSNPDVQLYGLRTSRLIRQISDANEAQEALFKDACPSR